MNNEILVTRSSMPPKEEYFEEISSIWDSHWLTNMGEKHNKLEQKLKEYLHVQNVSLFTNGHMALEMTLQAMELQGEVITTPFTFASTTHAIVRNGLIPVFCDIEADTYTIDVNKLEKLITPETCAILPVHVYGNICNVEVIEQIARKHNLKVIYDAAHAFGVEYKGTGIGNYGDASMFSFHATKVFNTIEGGAVCYQDVGLGKKLYELKNFGIEGPETISGIGANAKMNEFQAAMGLCNLRHLNTEIDKRKAVFEKYIELLSDVKGIKLPAVQNDVKSNYAYFPIVVDSTVYGSSRDEVYDVLAQNNIYARKYFYPLTNSYSCYRGQFDVTQTSVAMDISKSVLTLPMYADLDLENVEQICNIIKGKKTQ